MLQSWITAFNEHIAYSEHYLWAGASPDRAREATEDMEEECKPLGTVGLCRKISSTRLNRKIHTYIHTPTRFCIRLVALID